MLQAAIKDICEKIEEKNCILFVGAGVSRSCGLPSWNELIGSLAEDLGYDADVFQALGNPMTLAEYYKNSKNGYSKVVDELRQKWEPFVENVKTSKIHRLISEIGFPIIYTTNYDRLIEEAFIHNDFPFHAITSIQDIPKYQDGSQIVKYHGDIMDENSIVLAESDYYARLDFQGPLDLKLQNDLMGKTAVFIGYSMSDFNVRYLFYKISKLWETSPEAKSKSYIFMSAPNDVERDVLSNWGVERIFTEDHTDPKDSLETFLQMIRDKVEVDISKLNLSKTIAIDFDGVIHKMRDEWISTDTIDGVLIDGARECLRYLDASGYRIDISSARANCDRGKSAIKRWLTEQDIPFHSVSTRVGAKAYIDDLGFRFDGTWSIEKLKTWLSTPSWDDHPNSK